MTPVFPYNLLPSQTYALSSHPYTHLYSWCEMPVLMHFNLGVHHCFKCLVEYEGNNVYIKEERKKEKKKEK